MRVSFLRQPLSPQRSAVRSCADSHLSTHRSGLSLIEVTVATLLVGLLMISSLRMSGSVFRFRGQAMEKQRALFLAEELMVSICSLPYSDPDQISVFGREPTELLLRSHLDDVDDFHLWTESPLQASDGSPLAGFTGWSREVTVNWVNPDEPDQTVLLDQGAKRIQVSVSRHGTHIATLKSIRTNFE